MIFHSYVSLPEGNWYNSGLFSASSPSFDWSIFFQAELLQVLRQRDAELARLREERQHKAREGSSPEQKTWGRWVINGFNHGLTMV